MNAGGQNAELFCILKYCRNRKMVVYWQVFMNGNNEKEWGR